MFFRKTNLNVQTFVGPSTPEVSSRELLQGFWIRNNTQLVDIELTEKPPLGGHISYGHAAHVLVSP